MSDALAHLEPRSLWSYFSKIMSIPRPSKHEEKITAWLRSVAQESGWKVRDDKVGNIVIEVPATPGHENAPVVVLQGHLDMVCEKNKDTEHDFMNDPIRPRIEGDWLYGSGTTLGADNGIGVAAALAAASDPEVTHGPLELLLTIDEETGLTGAMGLDEAIIKGRMLINMDSEEDGKLFVGCAGGADTHLFVEGRRSAPASGSKPFKIEVTGLRGGHSGLHIHENRGNAVKLLTRLLTSAVESRIEFGLADIQGGDKHNAIPREAEATVWLPEDSRKKFEQLLGGKTKLFRIELQGIDDGLQIAMTPSDASGEVLVTEDRDRLLHLLSALPHGVLGTIPGMDGLVETSSNLAAVLPENGKFKIITSSRSSVDPTIMSVLLTIRSAGRLAGAHVETHDGYPGWKPDMDSPLLGVTRRVCKEVWGEDPEVTAVHAGLECGLLGKKIPDMDMISFGPQIEGAHSPEERVNIPTVDRFWKVLVRMLGELAA